MANYVPNSEKSEAPRELEPMTFEKASAQMPMKFHKHFVLWILWVWFAGNISNGILYLTGSYSSGIIELRGVEIAQGVVGVIVAALLFLARMRLKGFKIGGTLLLYLAQFINIGWIVISHFKVSSILSEINTLIQYGVYVKTPSLIVTLLLPVAILITLYFYYSKRKRLFYN